jgi:peptidylprolyl isomerase
VSGVGRLRRAVRRALLVAPLVVAACMPAKKKGPPTIETIRFARSLQVDLKRSTHTPSGLYWRDLVVGEGAEADSGHTVAVRYSGWLPDGIRFIAIAENDPPMPFVLGTNAVVPAWNEAMLGMKIGGVRQIISPASLAYGTRPEGAVPPNAIVVFQISLIEVRD